MAFLNTFRLLFFFAIFIIISNVADAATKFAIVHYRPELLKFEGNLEDIEKFSEESFKQGAKIVVFPELATSGYNIKKEELDCCVFTPPFLRLKKIQDISRKFNGYIIFGGIVANNDKIKNMGVIVSPTGEISLQAKRGKESFYAGGDVDDAYQIIKTPYGNMGVVICGDSYLPDPVRILSLKGADFIIILANWWGKYDQEKFWQEWARENGKWILVANRWGYEKGIFDCFMNDAPSTVITPEGKIQMLFRMEDLPEPLFSNQILYADLEPQQTNNYLISKRNVPYYKQHYREYNSITPPPPGNITTEISFDTNELYSSYLAIVPPIGAIFRDATKENDILNPEVTAEFQKKLSTIDISVLATAATLEKTNYIVVFQKNNPPKIFPSIHFPTPLTKDASLPILETSNARIAFLLNEDTYFPEVVSIFSHAQVDILVILCTINDTKCDNKEISERWPVLANNGMHIIGLGQKMGMIIPQNRYGQTRTIESQNGTKTYMQELNTLETRNKWLTNFIFDDINTLFLN